MWTGVDPESPSPSDGLWVCSRGFVGFGGGLRGKEYRGARLERSADEVDAGERLLADGKFMAAEREATRGETYEDLDDGKPGEGVAEMFLRDK